MLNDYQFLVRTLLASTKLYTQRGIKLKSDRDVYERAMNACIEACAHGNDLDQWLYNLHISAYKEKHIPNKLFSHPKRSWRIAHQQAGAIVNSIKLRFETGGCDPDSRFLQNIGGKRA